VERGSMSRERKRRGFWRKSETGEAFRQGIRGSENVVNYMDVTRITRVEDKCAP